MEQHTIEVTIRGASFKASGDKDAVNTQFEAFLKLVGGLPAPTPEPAAGTAASAPPGEPTAPASNGHQVLRNPGDELRGLREQCFRVEGDVVSLNALPRTEDPDFDAIALLLYGYRHLKGQTSIIVGDLLEALRQSGASPRTQTSKVVASHRNLVTQAGIKRATRYGLTNLGQSHAEEVLRGLF